MRRLITIPISHYCDKARWALDRAALAYVEEPHVQVVHAFAARRAGGGRTAPVLVCEEGVIRESGGIVGYAARHAPPDRALEPSDPVQRAEAMRLERWFDLELGPPARQWAYFHLRDQRSLGRRYNLTGVPAWERAAFPLAFGLLLNIVTRVLDVGPETADEAARRVGAVFDTVARRLDGRPYLVGNHFSRADLSFAALSAAVVLPEQFGVPFPPLDELPPAMAAGVRSFRDHPAGAFALRMYEQHRR